MSRQKPDHNDVRAVWPDMASPWLALSTGVRRRLLGPTVLMLLGGLLLGLLLHRQLSGAWFVFGVHPEVLQRLERSLDDQKQLAEADAGQAAVYRRRFEEIRLLLNRLRIVEHNRQAIVRRVEIILLGLFASVVLLGGGLSVLQQRRDIRRLSRLRQALEELSAGGTDIEVGDRHRDAIGAVGRMIETTSTVVARQRRRLAALGHLAVWQEAARRQAHELRTPLTSARLELLRLRDRVQEMLGEATPPVAHGFSSVLEEIDRLGALAHQVTSFARLPVPRLEHHDLAILLQDFVQVFANAWPGTTLVLRPSPDPMPVTVDPQMLRQVLTNLIDNSARSAPGQCTVTLEPRRSKRWVLLLVCDNGPGIDEAIRAHLFQPYVTTRSVGDGMGLGLAISKKIMLDHTGDLELAATSRSGTTMRLSLPVRGGT